MYILVIDTNKHVFTQYSISTMKAYNDMYTFQILLCYDGVYWAAYYHMLSLHLKFKHWSCVQVDCLLHSNEDLADPT